MFKRINVLCVVFLLGTTLAKAQNLNSPYSRYGLGDQIPSQNILSRGMGGVSAAYWDIQSVNFINPASYSRLGVTTFDFGAQVDSRTLREFDPPRKFNGVSPTISYIQLGIPLSKKRSWGMNIGLRPMTRVNYNLVKNERLPGIDSVEYQYEGDGGSYQAYVGTGVAIKNLAIGVNIGYLFGSKNYSTKTNFIPDSSNVFYYPSKHSTNSNFGGLFINAGVQYKLKLGSKLSLQVGGYGNLQKDFNASQDIIRQTYTSGLEGDQQIDSVFIQTDVEGTLTYPASYGVGFILNRSDKWLFGVDYTAAQWSNYRFFNETDLVQDSWKVNVGGQIVPNSVNPSTYWGRVAYRAGFNFGKDYIKVDDDLPVWSATLGFGFPLRKAAYSNQFTVINTAFEFGQRGNNSNTLQENFFSFSLGLTLSDLWFIKRRYD